MQLVIKFYGSVNICHIAGNISYVLPFLLVSQLGVYLMWFSSADKYSWHFVTIYVGSHDN